MMEFTEGRVGSDSVVIKFEAEVFTACLLTNVEMWFGQGIGFMKGGKLRKAGYGEDTMFIGLN